MQWFHLELFLLACVTALACVIPGIFLVLRGTALMSDAISHAIVLGIALIFLYVQQLHSPLLIVGAACTGLLTVALTEWIIQTECLKKDAAISLIYPLFFSLGVMIITVYVRNAHLDLDMVFLGELAFAPFNRFIISGVDCGPVGLWIMSCVLACNAIFALLFYKELLLSIFDATLATLFGFWPSLLYYGLMIVTSVTTVVAFDVVGAIVVIALMVTPPATALLLTRHIPQVIHLSILLSCTSALGGYVLANLLDVSIAGSIATMGGILFIAALIFSPHTGFITYYRSGHRYRTQLLQQVIVAYMDTKNSVPLVRAADDLKLPVNAVRTAIATMPGFLCTDTLIYRQ